MPQNTKNGPLPSSATVCSGPSSSRRRKPTKRVDAEKIGKFDSKLFAQTLHGLTISPNDEPGVLMEVTFENNGDIDRDSFLGEVVDGKQKIVAILPKLGK